jgi:hypothetical protein
VVSSPVSARVSIDLPISIPIFAPLCPREIASGLAKSNLLDFLSARKEVGYGQFSNFFSNYSQIFCDFSSPPGSPKSNPVCGHFKDRINAPRNHVISLSDVKAPYYCESPICADLVWQKQIFPCADAHGIYVPSLASMIETGTVLSPLGWKIRLTDF